MAAINKAVAFLKSADKPNISETARIFNVERPVLSKHFRGKRVFVAKANETKQLLTNKQELVLVKEIQKLCDWCFPPTPAIVTLWASYVCGKQPGKTWGADFKKKAEHALKKAQREQAREAKNAQKQLQIESAARRKRRRGRPAKQKSSSTAALTTVELIGEMMPIRLRSRRGRTIKKPARFKEKRIHKFHNQAILYVLLGFQLNRSTFDDA